MVAHENCGAVVQKRATIDAPYRFLDSGLPNVYLVGITYKECKKCGKQAADIPYLKDLLTKIARAVVRKEGVLDGAEIRFLRKRLGKKSVDFAKTVGVTPEHMSRLENGQAGSESVDRFIRVYYCLESKDATLQEAMNKHIDEYIASLDRELATSKFRVSLHNREWEAEAVSN